MSGSSRIGGSGFSGGFGGSGHRGDRSASLERFRRNRQVGDVVSGVFLRLETETSGWTLLEGEELLAHLPPEGPRPQEGEAVFFRIESLTPEVILRLLPSADPLARLALVLPPVALSQEGALYIAARDKLDSLLAGSGVLRRKSGDAARTAFIDAVAGRSAMAEVFAESYARSRSLVRAASRAGLTYFRHMPWLCPGVTALEISLWEKGESPVFAGATLPSGDRIIVRGSFESGAFRHRLNVIPVSSARSGKIRQNRRTISGESVADVVGCILAQAARADGPMIGRFSRIL